jgi:hypothetical protein
MGVCGGCDIITGLEVRGTTIVPPINMNDVETSIVVTIHRLGGISPDKRFTLDYAVYKISPDTLYCNDSITLLPKTETV